MKRAPLGVRAVAAAVLALSPLAIAVPAFALVGVAEDRGFEPLRAITQPAFEVVESVFAAELLSEFGRREGSR